jgi:hypothetical protein
LTAIRDDNHLAPDADGDLAEGLRASSPARHHFLKVANDVILRLPKKMNEDYPSNPLQCPDLVRMSDCHGIH